MHDCDSALPVGADVTLCRSTTRNNGRNSFSLRIITRLEATYCYCSTVSTKQATSFRFIFPVVLYLQLNRGSFESKHNGLVLPSFKLTTCFGLCIGHLQVTRYITGETLQCESQNRIHESKIQRISLSFNFPMFYISSPNIVRVIKSRRMRWAGHVARMGEERGVNRVLVAKPEGKRPLRRPKRRCVDNIRVDLQEVGCGYMAWIGLAQDRDSWRTLVSAVMNLWVP